MLTLLITLCTAVFFVTSAGASLAPFLNLLSRDLSTTLPAVAHLFSLQALTWGIASLVAGVIADRFGRRMILVGGIVLLGMMRLGFVTSDSYAAAVTWQVLSGIGGGAFMGLVYAVVSEHAAPEIRGRAMSWVITGQSLSLVLGVPLVTLLGTLGGWRGAIATHGGRIADRTRSRPRVFAIGSALTALVALPLLTWHPGIATSVAMGFVYSLVNAAGRPSLMATLAEVPSEIRSALFGLNITMASLG